jgi:hypothetical protein
MKNLTALTLALIMAISLVACGNKDNGDVEAAETPAPLLTDEVNVVVAEDVDAVSIIELTGTANIERVLSDAPRLDEVQARDNDEDSLPESFPGLESSIITARAGMRLMNRDTLRTFAQSAAWLLLEEDRAVELGELTALHIDKQEKGFVLTLSEGEVRAQIDRPLAEDEEFTVVAGDLALAVRGTIFTVALENLGTVVAVSVERGEVAVIDAEGEEIATVKAGESQSFATGKLVEFGGYEWRVLEVKDGQALPLSEYVLEMRPYHGEWYRGATSEEYATTWADCDLRAYLNGEFLNRFSESDRVRIAEAHNENKDNPWYSITGGADTTDRIFLLSLDEVVQHFGDSGQLGNRPSADTYGIDDEFNEARMAYAPNDGASWWWLRSPGGYSSYAAGIDNVGFIGVGGGGVTYDKAGVRPALWLILE